MMSDQYRAGSPNQAEAAAIHQQQVEQYRDVHEAAAAIKSRQRGTFHPGVDTTFSKDGSTTGTTYHVFNPNEKTVIVGNRAEARQLRDRLMKPHEKPYAGDDERTDYSKHEQAVSTGTPDRAKSGLQNPAYNREFDIISGAPHQRASPNQNKYLNDISGRIPTSSTGYNIISGLPTGAHSQK